MGQKINRPAKNMLVLICQKSTKALIHKGYSIAKKNKKNGQL
jgi:hypothetical protein